MTKLFVDFCKNAEKNLKDIKTMTGIGCGMAYINDRLFILRDDDDYKAYNILFGKWKDKEGIRNRFKFRVWDNKKRKIKEVTQITLDKEQTASISEVKGKVTVHLIYQPRYTLMQCTGLKDKNDKLIYEGDIVKSFHLSSSMQPHIFVGVVSYNSTQLYWYIEKEGNFENFLDTDDVFEVIGNIYENPELLEEAINAKNQNKP